MSQPQTPPEGLYLWGGVGRGKTYLMDLFFDALPFEQKMRTHFHRFMRRVHAELKKLDGQKDPLKTVAEKLAAEARVICFDEFFVSDITDAMILANLLDSLFSRGVCLVATSNIEPSGLYRDGLQRARFIPAIKLLETHTQVENVDGGIDYRLRQLEQAPLFYTPLNDDTESALELSFASLLSNAEHVQHKQQLEIENRFIEAKRVADDVAWFEFSALCDGPRSQNDYLEIAREYHAIVLSDVPVFSEKNDDQARRFIYLIDVLYDHGVKLLMSAERHFIQLYESGRLSFEFERTVSRLQEMQSKEYLAQAHHCE